MAVIRVENKKSEDAFGTKGNDTIYGDNRWNGLWGEGGNDRIFGGAGDDFLSGGPVAILSRAEQISTGSYLIRLPTKRASMSLRITIRSMTRFS